MYKRTYHQLIESRLREPRKFMQVVMGPRQVGKSTVVKQIIKNLELPYLFYDADEVINADGAWLANCWNAARTTLEVKKLPEIILIIDEIQKIPNWSETVKKHYDEDTFYDRNIKVLLLGSSRLMLVRGLSESLAGRFEEIRMPHWTYPEMRDAFGFSLPQYLYYGGYPGSAEFVNGERADLERFKLYIKSAIIETAVNRDIMNDTPIGKPALFRKAFELGASYSGQILSYTKLLGQLQDSGNTVTLAGYLNLLDQSCLLSALQKYSVDLARRRGSIPKFQVYNSALRLVSGSVSFETALNDKEAWGRIFESGIGAFLVNEAFTHLFEVYYWRERSDEVDFVLKRDESVVAIEVKSNNDTNTAGLERFKKEFNPQRTIIVGNGGIPAEEFLGLDLRELF